MLSNQTNASEGGFLPTNIKPTHYHLLIHNLDLGASWAYDGHVKINATVLEPTSQIVLHAQGLQVSASTITQQKDEVAASRIDVTNGFLTLDFPHQARAGDIIINISFHGVVKDSMEGFYRAKHDPRSPSSPTPISDGKDTYTLVTQFEPCDARTAFPCFDEPRLKATFDLELEIPEEQTALANMPMFSISRGQGAKGTKRVRFERTPIMSTYLLAWAIGTFEYIEQMTQKEHRGRKIPVRVYTAPGSSKYAQFAVNYAANTLDYFAEVFGVDYPMPKCDHVVVPEFISGAMENWGLIVYRPPKILFGEETSDNRVKLKACYVIAHELAHQWFGNLVTMNWWSALWLNEGFATWAGYLAVDHFYPSWNIWSHFTANVMSEAFSLDALEATHPIEAPVGSTWDARLMFDDISYLKGASVIRMLSQHMGPNVFLYGIVKYLQKHAFGNATTEDLFAALEEVSNIKVSQFMDSWIRQPGFPVLERTATGGQLGCCQRRFRPLHIKGSDPTTNNNTWHVPVRVGQASDTRTLTITAKQENMLGDAESDVLVPYDSTFCHVNYTTEELQRLLEQQADLKATEIIPLLRDLRALVGAGQKPVDDLFNVCSRLEHHRDVFVLGEVNKCLDLLGSAAGDARIDAGLLAFRQSLAEKQESQVSWNIRTEDYQAIEYQRTCLQTLLARQDKATLQAVERHYSDWVAGRETFAPSFRGIILGWAVANLGRPAFDNVMASYISDITVDGKEVCLSALGKVKDQELAKEFLDFVFSDRMTLQNVHHAFLGLGGNGKGRYFLWNYVKANWEVVYRTLSRSEVVLSWSLEMGLSNFDDMQVHKDMVDFFSDKDTSHFHQNLQVVLDCIKRNAAVKERFTPQLVEWFRQAQ